MKKLIRNSDLGIPDTTPLNRAIIAATRSILGINGINELYSKIPEGEQGVDFAHKVLTELGVSVHVGRHQLERIPATGSFILIANYPHGALDGLILIDIIARIRPDVKFLGNFLLTKIEELNSLFLPLDSFDANNSHNISGIRKALEHLESGAPLVVFPAGSVSTFQRAFGRMEDKPWSESMMKFIYKAGVPVVPLYIDGSNSLTFHLLGMIHPILRTMRLPRELTNKQGRSVSLAVGSALSVRSQSEFENIGQFATFLRINLYLMRVVACGDEPHKSDLNAQIPSVLRKERPKQMPKVDVPKSKIVDSVSSDLLEAEVDNLPSDALLMEVGRMKLYFVSAAQIPNTLLEIAHLRQETCRTMGERADTALDRDKFDLSYEHLFVWDSEKKAVVGAYRLGFGDRLMLEGQGFEGFYTYTLFEFSRGMNDMLRQSIELGRSFIAKEYRTQPQGLILLWRGVLLILIKYPQYRYLMGPVSMSGSYSPAAKWLMINFMKQNYWNREMAKSVVARHGLGALGRSPIASQLVSGIRSVALVEKLLRDVEPNGAGMPVLIRKYFQLSAKVLSLNVDPGSSNSLDALIFVDLRYISQAKIDLVAREFRGRFSREDIYAHFRALGNTNV